VEGTGSRAVAWWFRLVGPAIAILLLARLDLREIATAMAKVSWVPLLWSLALVVPLFAVKAWRWRLLLSGYGRSISLREAFELYTISAGAGALTPGAVGDFWKSFSPSVAERSIGLWTSILDRVYDMGFLVVLGAAVATGWIASRERRIEALAALAAVSGALWLARGPILGLLGRIIPAIPLAERTGRGHEIGATGATLVASAIAIVRFALLVRALDLPLGWTQVLVAFTLTSGVAALPLSVAGVGTRDLLLLGYLRGRGVPSAEAIALSSLCLLLILWNGLVAVCLWLAAPLARRETR
jgi:glycosyltransferase 2 family protein